MAINSCWPTNQSWAHYWPKSIMALIATIQLLFSFAILGLHIVIVVFGLAGLCYNVNAWYIMGFICWAFFLACWISIFTVSCCNRSSVGCATYVMIKNILAFIFSAVLIDFDRKFIDSQGYLYGADSINTSNLNNQYYSCINSVDSNNGNVDYLSISVSLAKGQLAASVIILVSSLVFVGIYIYVYIRALRDDQNMPNNGIPFGVQLPPTTTYVAGSIKINDQSGFIICHNCGTTLKIYERV